MKKIILLFFLFTLTNCSKNEDLNTSNLENVKNFKITVKEKNDSSELVYSQEYVIDDDGKVISENYISFNFPELSSYNVFKYNDKGNLITEIRNGEVFRKINWNNNIAEVYNNQDQKLAQFKFSNGNIVEYKDGFLDGDIFYRKLNYDANNNVVSIENESRVFSEYLDFKTSKINPLNLINSIAILKINYRFYSKNVFSTEKIYPYQNDDSYHELKFLEYYYTYDDDNRIITNTFDSSLYTTDYEYN